ncbi:MAG: D-amino acid aminotransferase [Methylococcales symbiont of Iophon sp. n. MRB-2018]|nr:MAG: D-amino acid aminotransferase [Methylococcales symbiont of Iophon sp. n. MRB-2018]KAF3980405.1 MAG: D-amino acid aminotransferase [Methylococcales symbiont of Iophon sp. n. MRB-2018]
MDKVYLNGEYLALSEAKISVLDRGFLFGDGVYEVIPSYSGHLFKLQEHLHRLENSLSLIRLDFAYTTAQWLEILLPLLDDGRDQYIYLQITRGVSTKRDHAFPVGVTPTVFAMCSDIKPLSNIEKGVKALTIEDSRWEMCNVKATTLLANVLLRQQAVEQGCAEAILHRQGYVTEGAASNLFAVINDVLMTPKKTTEILPGITRQVILELAEKNEIQYSEKMISLVALQSASEIWITSSTREIIPVVELDSIKVGKGVAGPLWQKMNQFFQENKSLT